MFSSSVPDVSLFDARYRAQRSVRSNVNWSGAVIGNRFLAGIDATYSMNLNQTGIENLNFYPSVRFRLATEANRPIFARASSIVGSTGSVAPSDARLNASFGNVLEQRSDLSSRNRQLVADAAADRIQLALGLERWIRLLEYARRRPWLQQHRRRPA